MHSARELLHFYAFSSTAANVCTFTRFYGRTPQTFTLPPPYVPPPRSPVWRGLTVTRDRITERIVASSAGTPDHRDLVNPLYRLIVNIYIAHTGESGVLERDKQFVKCRAATASVACQACCTRGRPRIVHFGHRAPSRPTLSGPGGRGSWTDL